MRTWWILGTLGLLLGFSTNSWGKDPTTLLGGVHPGQLINRPVDLTSNLAAPVPSTPSSITMSGILSKFNIPFLYQSKKPTTQLPQQTMPQALKPGLFGNAAVPMMPNPPLPPH